MKIDDFYKSKHVIHEVVEVKRSEICYNLILDLIPSKFSQQENVKILDVGCGDGSFIIKFKKHYDVFGVDISVVAVEETRKFGVNAYRVDVSCEKFLFLDGYFNIVYSQIRVVNFLRVIIL